MKEKMFKELLESVKEAGRMRREIQDPNKCYCNLRTKLIGDGCSVCNPEYWKEMKEEHDN